MRERGFTLVEVSVVLVIAGLLAAIAFPNLRAMLLNYRLEAVARELAMAIREVQMRAINGEAQTLRIYFDTGNESYIIDGAEPAGDRQVILPDGIDMSASFGGRYYLSFTLDGAPTGAGGVLLTNDAGREYHLTVLPATGRVVVERTK